jgi:hypothetical protein
MAKSYENINYTLRPAKNIERKMIVEGLRRLGAIERLESYRYVGFGSTYFSDFSLIHKTLGISSMMSIEKEIDDEDRFRFNKPFKCVRFKFGPSTSVLPTLSWSQKTILWLDYDGVLDRAVLTDIDYVCSRIRHGSVIVATVNSEPGPAKDDRVEALRARLGPDKIPDGVTQTNLAGWGTATAYRRILYNEIAEALNARNGAEAQAQKVTYKQLFNFHYADNAKMLTVGGLIFRTRDELKVRRCRFEDLDFIRTGEEAYGIEVPNLTFRELHHLESRLPLSGSGAKSIKRLAAEDIERYSKVYRYFPKFTEAEF